MRRRKKRRSRTKNNIYMNEQFAYRKNTCTFVLWDIDVYRFTSCRRNQATDRENICYPSIRVEGSSHLRRVFATSQTENLLCRKHNKSLRRSRLKPEVNSFFFFLMFFCFAFRRSPLRISLNPLPCLHSLHPIRLVATTLQFLWHCHPQLPTRDISICLSGILYWKVLTKKSVL